MFTVRVPQQICPGRPKPFQIRNAFVFRRRGNLVPRQPTSVQTYFSIPILSTGKPGYYKGKDSNLFFNFFLRNVVKIPALQLYGVIYFSAVYCSVIFQGKKGLIF